MDNKYHSMKKIIYTIKIYSLNESFFEYKPFFKFIK